MTEQLSFFNPISHASDPMSSHEAAEGIEKSGRRSSHAKIVLEAVREKPGLTSTELTDFIGDLSLYAVRRRLTDLLHRDLVMQGHTVARGGQRKQVTWFATERQR